MRTYTTILCHINGEIINCPNDVCYSHGLKNRFLSTIFCRYIGYWTTPKGYWVPIIEQEEYRKNIGKIAEISTIYQFRIDKSTKKSENEATHEATQEVCQKYLRYIGDISDIWANITDILPIYLKYRRFFWKFFFNKYLSIFLIIRF